PDVVEVEAGLLDALRQVERLRTLRDVRRPRAVEVGDVWILATADRGEHLLQCVVGVPVELEVHVHRRLRPVVLVDLRLERLPLDVRVAVPHHDRHGRLRRAERARRNDRGDDTGETDESEALHERTTFLDSQLFIYRKTTERVRLRGRSGSSDFARARATAVR